MFYPTTPRTAPNIFLSFFLSSRLPSLAFLPLPRSLCETLADSQSALTNNSNFSQRANLSLHIHGLNCLLDHLSKGSNILRILNFTD